MTYKYQSVGVTRAAKMLGKAPYSVRKLIEAGALRHLKVGAATKISLAEIDRFQRYGSYDPATIQEQANVQDTLQEEAKASTLDPARSEIFRDRYGRNQGATLPSEELRPGANRALPSHEGPRASNNDLEHHPDGPSIPNIRRPNQ